jgi:glycosyltransferase involved in cell wall biosynthesis
MRRKVLYFFPHNPYPPRSGAHQRCLEVLGALRELGHDVTLCSSALVADNPWTPDSAEYLRRNLVGRLCVHSASPLDYAVAGAIVLPHRLLRRPLAFDSRAFCPPGLRRLFGRLLAELDPEVVLISYPFWDRLLDHRAHRHRLRVNDTIDLCSVNVAMRAALARHVPMRPLRPESVPDRLLDERLFDGPEFAPSPREFAIYDRYDCCLAISGHEADLIARHAPHTRVVHVPMSMTARPLENDYRGPALFAAGANPFNLQGYCWFHRKVLAALRAARPAFSLQVTGACCRYLPPAENVTLAGFVPDLAAAYATARFAVCPVFGGTGQQVKVVEAMAHGVPVVALRRPAEQSPIRHGDNGLVADTAEEFAAHCRALWDDAGLCARLGRAARETIAAEYTPGQLARSLETVLSPAGGAVR